MFGVIFFITFYYIYIFYAVFFIPPLPLKKLKHNNNKNTIGVGVKFLYLLLAWTIGSSSSLQLMMNRRSPSLLNLLKIYTIRGSRSFLVLLVRIIRYFFRWFPSHNLLNFKLQLLLLFILRLNRFQFLSKIIFILINNNFSVF